MNFIIIKNKNLGNIHNAKSVEINKKYSFEKKLKIIFDRRYLYKEKVHENEITVTKYYFGEIHVASWSGKKGWLI